MQWNHLNDHLGVANILPYDMYDDTLSNYNSNYNYKPTRDNAFLRLTNF